MTSSIRRSGGCSTAPRGAARHAACESCFRPRRRRGAACQTARRTPASRVQHRPPPTSVRSSWLQLELELPPNQWRLMAAPGVVSA